MRLSKRLIRASKTHWWKTLLSFLFIVLFVAFLSKQNQEIDTLSAIIFKVNIWFLFLGLATIGLSIVVQGLFYQTIFQSIGKSMPLKNTVSLYLRRYFLSSFIPGGFSLAQYTYSGKLKSHEISDLESHLASSLYLLVGAVAYIAILLPAIMFLLFTGQLAAWEWYLSMVVIILTVALIYEFLSLLRQKGWLYRMVKKILPDLPAFIKSWRNKSVHKRSLFKAFVYALIVQVMAIMLLLITFEALHLPVSLVTAVVGYVITILLLTVSPLFQGIGLVEFSLAYALIRFGLTSQQAFTATLLFRLFHLWVPFLLGLVLAVRKKIPQEFNGS